MWEFSPITLKWTELNGENFPGIAPLPPAREGHGFVECRGRLYLYGGEITVLPAHPSIASHSIVTDMTACTSSPGLRQNLLSDMYYFEPETRNWTRILVSSESPGVLESFGFTGFNGSLFLFGGRDRLCSLLYPSLTPPLRLIL